MAMQFERFMISPIFTTDGYRKHRRWDSVVLESSLSEKVDLCIENDIPSVMATQAI